MQFDSEERFIEVVRKMETLAEVINFANSECDRIEKANRSLRSRAARDKSTGPRYRDYLGRFLHFVQWDQVASSSSSDELETFRAIVEELHRKKKKQSN